MLDHWSARHSGDKRHATQNNLKLRAHSRAVGNILLMYISMSHAIGRCWPADCYSVFQQAMQKRRDWQHCKCAATTISMSHAIGRCWPADCYCVFQQAMQKRRDWQRCKCAATTKELKERGAAPYLGPLEGERAAGGLCVPRDVQ